MHPSSQSNGSTTSPAASTWLRPRVAYLVVQDGTERGRDVARGRFDLNVDEARPYKVSGDDATEVTQVKLVDAGMRWVAELAASNTVGGSWRWFREKAWGSKGLRLETSGQLVRRGRGSMAGAGYLPVDCALQAALAQLRPSADPAVRMAVAVIEARWRAAVGYGLL